MDNEFYSIDRLVEFGMSMAVANQMVSSMNKALDHMNVPGANIPASSQQGSMYYAVINGEQTGPYSLTEISRLINDKKIVKETYVWKPGMEKWDIAQNVEEILRLVALSPPPIPKTT